MTTNQAPLRIHRAWLIVVLAACTLVTAGAFLPMAGLLAEPLHREFDAPFGAIGFAVAVNMALNGVTAPFAAALMDRFGIRRVAVAALVTIAAGAALTTMMTGIWQLTLYWGVLVGIGTGSLSMAFAATVAETWFVRRSGLVTGILSAAGISGQLAFQPLLAWLTSYYQWRTALVTLALAAAAVASVAWLLLRDHPADVGLPAYGAECRTPKPRAQPGAARRALAVLRRYRSSPRFWTLVGTFGVCGATTNGVVWALFVPAASEHGMPTTTAAVLLAVIGVCNLLGSLAAGWLTDRVDPRVLLAACYSLRACALASLPILLAPSVHFTLLVVLVVYGLVDMSTVPPTVALCRRMFPADSGVVFGWLLTAHQLGAGLMALLGGLTGSVFGSHAAAWFAAAPLLVLAAALALRLPTHRLVARTPSLCAGGGW